MPGDERAIAALQWGAWRALLTGEELAAQGLSEERLRAGWEAALSSPRPASAALVVALHGNSVVGFALAGPDDEAGVVRGQASVAGGPSGAVRGQAASAGGPPGVVRGQAVSAGGSPGAVRG
ncbi:MAG: GNAT family N-acetyltransferase, partial [Actinomyces sp.]